LKRHSSIGEYVTGVLEYRIENYPISRMDSTTNLTGCWRAFKPVFKKGIAPCSMACPNFQDIPQFMFLFREGQLNEALALIRAENPMPAVTGRVCPRLCEEACNRKEFDEPVNIRDVERLIGDYGLDIPMKRERAFGRETIAVVGSGPAGLTAAYFMVKHGVNVDLFEREAQPGGMLRYGIPEYRLPRTILDKEIQKILQLGIRLFTETEIRPEDIPSLLERYSYVFFCPGLWGTNTPDLGYKGDKLYDGIGVLKSIHSANPPELGQRIAVVGGGNTALDVTRVLMRMGKEVSIVYRRTLNEAPAFQEEVKEALEEHVTVLEEKLITWVQEEEGGRLKIEIREAIVKDDQIVPGSHPDLKVVDSIVAATGQVPEMKVDHERVFIGGDYETGEGTVVQAIASGKRGAFEILRRIGIRAITGWEGAPKTKNGIAETHVIGFRGIKTNWFEKGARVRLKKKDPEQRIKDFTEIVEAATAKDLRLEANRCFSCGTCTFCGTCWYFCPEACVIMDHGVEDEIKFDLDFCKGCALCSASCPRGCIGVEQEQ
jgi:NADPH-dependent glutamate synthase beta subunit-like oxidoreductase